ncbi:hypothetical protein CLOSTASPAR_00630 [[Clostridium] asparagiforme DSM 15981]|uniref:Uncharacterized protein n=1 Tax=[Clostridium] asparagiforme DSM 15981 TaxID=518636 RepID=C0CUU1_9FIRM|nr:hypothetical protein CLOSTASPAR_00630 [[Clostridium] asparagiforme DSM 15981]
MMEQRRLREPVNGSPQPFYGCFVRCPPEIAVVWRGKRIYNNKRLTGV